MPQNCAKVDMPSGTAVLMRQGEVRYQPWRNIHAVATIACIPNSHRSEILAYDLTALQCVSGIRSTAELRREFFGWKDCAVGLRWASHPAWKCFLLM